MSKALSDHWDQAYAAGREAGVRDCISNLVNYIDETHQHVGDLTCQPFAGDRCDMTAALRVAVNRLKAMP